MTLTEEDIARTVRKVMEESRPKDGDDFIRELKAIQPAPKKREWGPWHKEEPPRNDDERLDKLLERNRWQRV